MFGEVKIRGRESFLEAVSLEYREKYACEGIQGAYELAGQAMDRYLAWAATKMPVQAAESRFTSKTKKLVLESDDGTLTRDTLDVRECWIREVIAILKTVKASSEFNACYNSWPPFVVRFQEVVPQISKTLSTFPWFMDYAAILTEANVSSIARFVGRVFNRRDGILLLVPADRPIQMVEIGVDVAVLSKYLLDNRPNLTHAGVDPYFGRDLYSGFSPGLRPEDEASEHERYASAKQVFDQYDRAELHRISSLEGAEKFLKEGRLFDVVYVDGAHSYENVKNDIEAWHKLVRPGGILAGEDYERWYPGVIAAVNEAVAARSITLNLAVDGLWWLYT